MPTYAYYCDVCKESTELIVARNAKPTCKQCSKALERQFSSDGQFFIHERDKAPNSHQNARYREWVNSPAVQERIRSGQLVREGHKNELQDYLDEMS